MYRDNLSEFVSLCRSQRVPTSADRQEQLLRAIRFALWSKKYDELQAIFMTCGMSESEIIERKSFYLKFAAMMCRLITLIPTLSKYFMIDYIAEDMIDGGDPELVIAGNRMNTVIAHAKAGDKDIKGSISMPSVVALTSSQLGYYQKNPAAFIADFIEPNWEFDSDRTYAMAAVAELLLLEPEDKATVGPILMNAIGQSASAEEFYFTFASTTAKLLTENGYSEWGKIFMQIFAPLIGNYDAEKALASAGSGSGSEATAPAGENFGELELEAISNVWKNQGVDRALPLAKQRLIMTPGDPYACGMLGNIYLAQMNIPLALACLSRAYWLEPDTEMVVFVLGQAFQAGYFAKQVDLCRARLKNLPAYRAFPERFRFGVELFIKCDEPETTASVNGHEVGKCPLQLRQVKPGTARITWTLADGGQKTLTVELEDATIAKYRYHPDSGRVSNEISRDGSVTIFTAEGSRELSDMVASFLVDDLNKLPNPSVEECLGT